MNKKETLIWSIIDNVIKACDIPRADGTHSISREDIVGKSREENVVMARALVVEQMVHAGFTITSIAYILNKTNGIEFKIGEIVGTTTPIFATDGTNMMVVNLKVKVDGSTVDYNNIPANNTSVSYNNGNLIIAESKQTIQSEVEATLQHANYVVEHIEDYKNQIVRCEEVLKELNPQFAKDKARDERIAGIETEVAGMKGDIAKILAAVTKQ